MLQLMETDAAKPISFFLTFNLEILTYNDQNRARNQISLQQFARVEQTISSCY